MNRPKISTRLSPAIRQNILLFVLLFLFGVIVTNHVTIVHRNRQQTDLSGLYRTRQAELEQAQTQYDNLIVENERLLQAKEEAITNLLNREGNTALLAELNRVKVLAGLTAVQGPGVAVTLDDKPGFDVIKDTADALVHDSDVRHVLDLLKASGAAALSVNDQRIVNSSYVFCIGPTILCNMQRLTPPYVIRAIGDPGPMQAAILQDPMLSLRQSPEIGLIVKTDLHTAIVCPAFAEADDLDKFIDRLVVPAA